MNSGVHVLAGASLAFDCSAPGARPVLNYRYRQDGLRHRAYSMVVEESLHKLLLGDRACTLEVVEFARGGLAAALFPDAFALVVGVTDDEGKPHVAVPKRLVLAKWLGVAMAVTAAGVASYHVLKQSSWLWLCVGVAGTHVFRTCLALPGSFGVARSLTLTIKSK